MDPRKKTTSNDSKVNSLNTNPLHNDETPSSSFSTETITKSLDKSNLSDEKKEFITYKKNVRLLETGQAIFNAHQQAVNDGQDLLSNFIGDYDSWLSECEKLLYPLDELAKEYVTLWWDLKKSAADILLINFGSHGYDEQMYPSFSEKSACAILNIDPRFAPEYSEFIYAPKTFHFYFADALNKTLSMLPIEYRLESKQPNTFLDKIIDDCIQSQKKLVLKTHIGMHDQTGKLLLDRLENKKYTPEQKQNICIIQAYEGGYGNYVFNADNAKALKDLYDDKGFLAVENLEGDAMFNMMQSRAEEAGCRYYSNPSEISLADLFSQPAKESTLSSSTSMPESPGQQNYLSKK